MPGTIRDPLLNVSEFPTRCWGRLEVGVQGAVHALSLLKPQGGVFIVRSVGAGLGGIGGRWQKSGRWALKKRWASARSLAMKVGLGRLCRLPSVRSYDAGDGKRPAAERVGFSDRLPGCLGRLEAGGSKDPSKHSAA